MLCFHYIILCACVMNRKVQVLHLPKGGSVTGWTVLIAQQTGSTNCVRRIQNVWIFAARRTAPGPSSCCLVTDALRLHTVKTAASTQPRVPELPLRLSHVPFAVVLRGSPRLEWKRPFAVPTGRSNPRTVSDKTANQHVTSDSRSAIAPSGLEARRCAHAGFQAVLQPGLRPSHDPEVPARQAAASP